MIWDFTCDMCDEEKRQQAEPAVKYITDQNGQRRSVQVCVACGKEVDRVNAEEEKRAKRRESANAKRRKAV